VLVFDTPWIAADPPLLGAVDIERLVAHLADGCYEEAAVFVSSHQSALPMALVLRLAGVARIAAVSVDYPGSLVDVRIPGDPDIHEVERGLLVAHALEHRLPAGDDGGLRVMASPPPGALPDRYVVAHSGASLPARTLERLTWVGVVDGLHAAGWDVVLTGSGPGDSNGVVRSALGPDDADVIEGTDLGTLARRDRRCGRVVHGKHRPDASRGGMGTPVVVAFPPTVPLQRWGPWRVPHVVLGHQHVPCRGCRARTCPLPTQVCLASVHPADVVAAVEQLHAAALKPAAAREPVAARKAAATLSARPS
jgi:hypothetical protein